MGILDARWDESCPGCGAKIVGAIHGHFEASDYADSFDFECPLCEAQVYVQVHRIPEFETAATPWQ